MTGRVKHANLKGFQQLSQGHLSSIVVCCDGACDRQTAHRCSLTRDKTRKQANKFDTFRTVLVFL